MGRMDNNGFTPAIFMQGTRQNGCDNGYADAAYGNGVCSDCDSNAAYTTGRSNKGCDDCDNNATYTTGRSNKGCDDCSSNADYSAGRSNKGCGDWDNNADYAAGRSNKGCGDWDNNADYAAGRSNKGCGDWDNNADYAAGRSNKGCGEWDNKAEYTNRRSKGCSCDNDGATHIYFETCENSKEVSVIGSCEEDSLGRVLDVGVTLRNVCPGRCSSLGINLSEMDEDGTEYARGFRAVSVPAHNARTNKDIQLDAVRFVLPEDRSLQRRRHLIVRTTHHYLDDGSI